VQGVGGGYQLEFGLKGTEFNSEIELRLANLWVETAIGKVALGRASQATDGITEISVANTTVSSKMLNLKPTSSFFGFDNLPFNGTRLDLVRYETPSLGGVFLSASYSADDWDVALKYAGELGGFRLAGGIGYSEHQGAAFWWLGDPQRKTVSGSASIMHIASGLFLNGAYGKVDGDVMLYGTDPKAWQIQGGIENKVLEFGKTTAFLEYGELKAWGSDVSVIGIGLVQSIDAAAIDLYLNAKRYEGGGDDATVFITGARAKF
jgi:predicted porin